VGYPAWTRLFKDKSNILLIHHWDTDGISSAAIFTDYINNINGSKLRIDYVVPSAGTYRLLPGDNLNIPRKNYDFIAILD
jgi:single-stranded DNA-specific DHH superfamily exonuclease